MEMTPQLQQFIQLISKTAYPRDIVGYAAKLIYGFHITLREERMSPGMCKHHIYGLEFDAVLHHFTEADTGDPHSHPWAFTTHILKGSYVEEVYMLPYSTPGLIIRNEGSSHEINQHIIHRLVSLPQGECWTLVLPEYQEGGTTYFYKYNKGWLRRRWDEKEWREMR